MDMQVIQEQLVEVVEGSAEWLLFKKREAGLMAKILLEQKPVIFDTETTGFGTDDEIVQIAVIDSDGNVLVDTLVRPSQSILNSHIHGITDEMTLKSPTFAEVARHVLAAFHGKRVVAYNYAFDSRLLDQTLQRCGLGALPAFDHDCAMLIYSQYIIGDYKEKYGNFRFQKLSHGANQFHLEYDGEAHNALAEAKMTLAILRKMAEWYESGCPF